MSKSIMIDRNAMLSMVDSDSVITKSKNGKLINASYSNTQIMHTQNDEDIARTNFSPVAGVIRFQSPS